MDDYDYFSTQPELNTVNPSVSVDGLQILFYLFVPIIVISAVSLYFYFLRRKLQSNQFLHHEVFVVRLPKVYQETEKSNGANQHLRETVAKMESVITAIGGLKAQRGFHYWLHGRQDIFSLEIVVHLGTINFYLVTPVGWGQYLEKQVHALYPDAQIQRVKDYNIFGKHNHIAAAYVMTRHKYVLPIKTYMKEEVDLINPLLNVMTKLEAEESMAVQYVIRSAKKSWHNRVRKLVKLAYKNNSLDTALKHNKLLIFLDAVTNTTTKAERQQKNAQKRMSALEEEALKNIENKNAKAGLDVNIRVVVSSPSQMQAERHLMEAINSYSQYNYYSYGNAFINSPQRKREAEIIKSFIYRVFNEEYNCLFNTEEVASLFHFPLSSAEMPNINWLESKGGSAPVDLPTEGLVLGYNNYRGVAREVRIKEADRLRHLYLVGKSGVGKSFLLANMAIQDVLAGRGLCVLDPHGDLIDDILLRIPPERIQDVILFSPADTARPVALNLLEFDPAYPEQKSFVINEMIGIFDKLYDLKATGGPIFEQYMRNAMLLIMSHPESGCTLMEIPKVLADAEFRKLKLKYCNDPTVVDFWVKEAEKAGGDAALANVVPYVTSKLTSFISNDMMRPIIGQAKSSFNLRQVMDEKKILLVSLPKGLVGELNAYLLGMILVGKILMAALSRADMPREQRNNFFLYIDEFQNFTTQSINQVLSEARKYGLGLTLAHQYIGQLTKGNDHSIKDSIFGNVGTTISFKVGPEDAEFLSKLYEPDFSATDLVNVDKYTAFTKLLVDNMNIRPFTLSTPNPLFGQEYPANINRIKEYSRLRYGRDRRVVEADIFSRLPQLS